MRVWCWSRALLPAREDGDTMLHWPFRRRSAAPRVPGQPNELFCQWAASARMGLYLLQQGRFVWGNPYLEQATGYPLADLMATPALDLVHPDDRAWVRCQARAML